MSYSTSKCLFIALLFLFFAATTVSAQNGEKIIKTGSFNELSVSGKFEITLVKGDSESLTIMQTSIDPANVEVKLSSTKLLLTLKKNKKNEDVAVLIITYKQLQSIEANYEASITFETLQAKNLNLSASINSVIKGEIQAQTLTAKATSESKIILTGNVTHQEATIKWDSVFDALQMKSKSAQVVAGAFGYAKVFVTDVLDATVKTGGDIAYAGTPNTIKKSVSTGGNLNEISAD